MHDSDSTHTQGKCAHIQPQRHTYTHKDTPARTSARENYTLKMYRHTGRHRHRTDTDTDTETNTQTQTQTHTQTQTQTQKPTQKHRLRLRHKHRHRHRHRNQHRNTDSDTHTNIVTETETETYRNRDRGRDTPARTPARASHLYSDADPEEHAPMSPTNVQPIPLHLMTQLTNSSPSRTLSMFSILVHSLTTPPFPHSIQTLTTRRFLFLLNHRPLAPHALHTSP